MFLVSMHVAKDTTVTASIMYAAEVLSADSVAQAPPTQPLGHGWHNAAGMLNRKSPDDSVP